MSKADRPRRRRVARDEPIDVVAATASLRRLPRELPQAGPGGDFLRGLAAELERAAAPAPRVQQHVSDHATVEEGQR